MPEVAARQLTEWLQDYINRNGGVAGSIHLVRGEELILSAAHNIPDNVLRVTAVVPSGKGMAGLALRNQEPTLSCNIQTDDSGNVLPRARSVQGQAAIALPVRNSTGDIHAVVGIAFAEEREISDDEIHKLLSEAAQLPV